jgi:hypothetical protein
MVARPVTWMGVAVGAGIGIGALAYTRRRRSRWDRAKDQASHLIDTTRENFEPWMGVAVGTAAAGTAVAAYLRNRKESGWQRAGKRASEIASRIGTQARSPWANLAATAAIGLASAAYANRARRRTVRGIDATTADRINAVTEKGLQVLRHVRGIAEQTGELYPRIRRAIA